MLMCITKTGISYRCGETNNETEGEVLSGHLAVAGAKPHALLSHGRHWRSHSQRSASTLSDCPSAVGVGGCPSSTVAGALSRPLYVCFCGGMAFLGHQSMFSPAQRPALLAWVKGSKHLQSHILGVARLPTWLPTWHGHGMSREVALKTRAARPCSPEEEPSLSRPVPKNMGLASA